MDSRLLQQELQSYFRDQVKAVEPASGWWADAVARATEPRPRVPLWERLKRALSQPLWRTALAALVIVVAGVLVWRGVAGTTPGSVSSQVDFIKLDGITYVSDSHSYAVPEGDLSSFGKIKNEVQSMRRGYQLKDGDAAFLEAGTGVYSMAGYSPTFRLAAMRDQKWFIYEADTNPKATKGSDLIDIGGKVSYITINSSADKSELASITDSTVVDELVNMVLTAPVDQTLEVGGSNNYILVFHLRDGTTSSRFYSTDSDVISRGIEVPADFGTMIAAVLGERQH